MLPKELASFFLAKDGTSWPWGPVFDLPHLPSGPGEGLSVAPNQTTLLTCLGIKPSRTVSGLHPEALILQDQGEAQGPSEKLGLGAGLSWLPHPTLSQPHELGMPFPSVSLSCLRVGSTVPVK